MRACVQRVTEAQVQVDDQTVGQIEQGLLVLLGVHQDDEEQDARYLAEKIVHLRLFEDQSGRMNRSLMDIEGSLLVVSQFTLLGDCRKGRRPSFTDAASPEKAERLYERFMAAVRSYDVPVASGRFRQHMRVQLVNDGPVTLLVESP